MRLRHKPSHCNVIGQLGYEYSGWMGVLVDSVTSWYMCERLISNKTHLLLFPLLEVSVWVLPYLRYSGR